MPVTGNSPIPRRPHAGRSWGAILGVAILSVMVAACVLSLPWTTAAGSDGVPRYNAGSPAWGRLPPIWWARVAGVDDATASRYNAAVDAATLGAIARRHGVDPADAVRATTGAIADELRASWPPVMLGTDVLGRSLLVRCVAGGGVSLLVGVAAAILSVMIGTLYGAAAAYAGGWVDGVMMRIVDVLYGLPSVLLVVLLAVASDALVSEYLSRQHERAAWVVETARAELSTSGRPVSRTDARSALDRDAGLASRLAASARERFPPRDLAPGWRAAIDLGVLLVAIGGVSWLTTARVIRGQVLSLKARPFVEAARAIGASPVRVFFVHLLPNLAAPIVVYATLAVPQAILQESFLSFLGIGVKPPVPSWGNLASEGLGELNPYESHWWLLLFPCGLLAITLLSLNAWGERLRARLEGG